MSARPRPSRSPSGLIILATAALFVPDPDPPSVLDDRLPASDRDHLQPVRLHHRHLGATASSSSRFIPMLIVTPLTFLGGAFYSIDMLPPSLADHHPVQPGRLSDQRLSLELLRHRRRRSRDQPCDDPRLLLHLPRHRRLDLQDRIPAEELKAEAESAGWSARPSPSPSRLRATNSQFTILPSTFSAKAGRSLR